MKVFVINVVCGTGSTGRIVADICQLLEENEGQCRVAYSRGTAPKNMDTIKIGSKADIYGHALLSRITDKQGLYSAKATRKLIREIKKYEPDVIHLHNIHGYYLHVEILFDFLREYQKPVIWTLHDCWSFTGHCAYFSKAQCERWKTGCYSCSQLKEYPASWGADHSQKNWLLKKKMTEHLDLTVVTVSEWLKSVVSESFLKQYPIRTIYNGLDLDIFKPIESTVREEYGLQDKYIVLGVANVWDDRKGFDDFLRMAERLNDNYRIMLVGVSQKQKERLKSNMIGIDKTENIQRLVALYSAADVYVNASVEETLGMTTLEALACGTPAVVYDTTGIPEVLADMPEMIVQPHDIEKVIKIVEELAESKPDKEFLRRIAKKYDKWDRFQEYVNLYKEVVQ